MSDVATLVRRYVERYNSNDVEGMLDCCAEDVVFETVTNPGGSIRLSGKTEMREVIEATTRAFHERRHAAGLMRINHVGEVCAQGLYFGQAAVARDGATRAHLLDAAQEETDHLAWCAQRLRELDSRPSLFNPIWYAGSYTIGTLAGLRGDGWNLGFVVETERQVEAHLEEHLATLPPGDERSRAILRTMKADEARHADEALAAGARVLPSPIPRLMALTSRVMKAIAYRG